MYITIIIILVRFPIIYSQPNDNHNLINAIIITLLNSSQMFISFSSTVFVVLFHPEENTKGYFQRMMMRHAQQRTAIEMEERTGRITSVSHSAVVYDD